MSRYSNPRLYTPAITPPEALRSFKTHFRRALYSAPTPDLTGSGKDTLVGNSLTQPTVNGNVHPLGMAQWLGNQGLYERYLVIRSDVTITFTCQ